MMQDHTVHSLFLIVVHVPYAQEPRHARRCECMAEFLAFAHGHVVEARACVSQYIYTCYQKNWLCENQSQLTTFGKDTSVAHWNQADKVFERFAWAGWL